MKQRKLNNAIGIALGLGAVMGLGLMGDGVIGTANAGISTTKHNLGANGTGSNHVAGSSDTTEICVFCHTPHGANQDLADTAPLWNKATASATYLVYTGAGTLDATTSQPQGISLACLSCHDGAQAMDNMINAPGSGGYVASGVSQGWAFSGQSQLTSGIASLGTDLRNDHPITIQYGAGTAAWTDGQTAFNDPDFKTLQVVGSRRFVDALNGSTDSLTKEDMILYNTSGSDYYVECASCHDPHTSNTTFLRIENTGSNVCLSCHNK